MVQDEQNATAAGDAGGAAKKEEKKKMTKAEKQKEEEMVHAPRLFVRIPRAFFAGCSAGPNARRASLTGSVRFAEPGGY